MYNSQETALRIKNLAKQKGKSIGVLQQECGLGKNAINQSADSQEGMKSKNLYTIAEYLDVSVDYLLGRTNTPSSVQPPNSQDQITTEMLKAFEKLSFKDKIAVLNYTLNIENPPQNIVQSRKSAEEPKRERVPYVARDLSGKNTKGFIDISDEDLAKAEVEDYSKYD